MRVCQTFEVDLVDGVSVKVATTSPDLPGWLEGFRAISLLP